MEPEVLILSESPHGNLEAVVEQDDRVAFLYLRAPSNPDFGLKTCWLRNLQPAPEALDVDGMREGNAPMQPREYCKFPDGQPLIEKERLRIVWLPEGDGVAVLEDDEFLAVIPSWGGTGGFDGYCRDAVGQGPVAGGLEDPSVIVQRIKDAEAFWKNEQDWPSCQNSFLSAYEQVLGPHTRYFSIDGDKWPARALIRVDREDRVYLLTLGISQRPQPQVEMHYEDPSNFRRFEFAACFSTSVDDALIMKFASYLSAQATLPWDQFTHVSFGHTITCGIFEDDKDLGEFAALLFCEHPAGAPNFDLPRMGSDRVNLLWTIPITAKEREFSMKHGSQKFLAKFPGGQPSCVIQKRRKVLGGLW